MVENLDCSNQPGSLFPYELLSKDR